METINNVTSAATRAIWGDSASANKSQSTESGTEPLSGATGNTASGEPYDTGNKDPTNTKSATTPGKTETYYSPESGVSSHDVKKTDTFGNTAATGPIRPEHDTDKTGMTSANQHSNSFGSDRPSNANDTSGPGAEPSVGADPASAPQNTQKQQGADRPREEPSSDEHTRIKETKANAEKAQDMDTNGPGPQPSSTTNNSATGPPSSSGDDNGLQKESHGTGTGEKYVKSSGLKADGGDFDAANPGAGKEADRLLETKGVHREPVNKSGGGDTKPDPLEKESKPSLGEKIKAKLHKH